jgi:hypothetical protein
VWLFGHQERVHVESPNEVRGTPCGLTGVGLFDWPDGRAEGRPAEIRPPIGRAVIGGLSRWFGQLGPEYFPKTYQFRTAITVFCVVGLDAVGDEGDGEKLELARTHDGGVYRSIMRVGIREGLVARGYVDDRAFKRELSVSGFFGLRAESSELASKVTAVD